MIETLYKSITFRVIACGIYLRCFYHVACSFDNLRSKVLTSVKTFRDRTVVYRNRKDKKKVGDIKVRLDLTRKRLGVLREAKEFVKSCTDADFVFADINCSLVLKLKNGKFIFLIQ